MIRVRSDLCGWVQTPVGKGQVPPKQVGSFIGGREGRGESEREHRAASWKEKEREKREKERDAERRERRGRNRQSFAF